MSRLAQKPILIPDGVEVRADGNVFYVKGLKGEIKREFKTNIIKIEIKDKEIYLSRNEETQLAQALVGTYYSHLTNMIQGVVEEYVKKLIVDGVGYKWEVKGNNLELSLGFSHPIVVEILNGLTVTAEKNNLTISGVDKEAVGQFAAKIRSLRTPEPYKGKGIRYEDEVIRRKQGKKTV